MLLKGYFYVFAFWLQRLNINRNAGISSFAVDIGANETSQIASVNRCFNGKRFFAPGESGEMGRIS